MVKVYKKRLKKVTKTGLAILMLGVLTGCGSQKIDKGDSNFFGGIG